MKPGLVLALIVSFILITGASWLRLSPNKNQEKLASIEQVATNKTSQYSDELLNSLSIATTTNELSREPVSETDLIGQRLILDYVGLAAKGQATEANIAALASKYVESIPTLNKTEQMSITDLKVVSDAKINFQNYADKITIIYREYAESVSKVETLSNNLNTLNAAFYSSVSDLSEIYTNVASKLKDLPVPSKLVSAHLKLLNSYLSSAEATKTISETETDSAKAFAGLIALNSNIDEEEQILNDIAQILSNNGI